MKIKKLLLGIVGLMTLALLLSACNSEPKESPEAVIQKFKTAMTQINSGDLSLDFVMQGIDVQDKVDLKGGVEIRFDRREALAPKTEISANLTGAMKAGGQSLTGDLSFVVRMLGKAFFVKLNKLDSSDPSLLTLKPAIAVYQGKWLKLADELLPQSLKTLQTKDEAALARDQELKELFQEGNLFAVTKEYGLKTLNGNKVYHYGVRLNKKEVEDYLKASLAITGGTVNEQDVSEASRLVDAVTEAELWIGAKDYLLYKGFIRLNPPAAPESPVNMLIELNLEGNRYNKAVEIEIPEEAQEFNPLALFSEPLSPVTSGDQQE